MTWTIIPQADLPQGATYIDSTDDFSRAEQIARGLAHNSIRPAAANRLRSSSTGKWVIVWRPDRGDEGVNYVMSPELWRLPTPATPAQVAARAAMDAMVDAEVEAVWVLLRWLRWVTGLPRGDDTAPRFALLEMS